MITTLLHIRDSERMVAYTVHEPPNAGGDRLDRAEKLVFVKDGFTFAAALVAPIWFLVNRMWVVLLGYLAGLAVISTILNMIGMPEAWIVLVQVAVNVLIGFEADSLKRWTLERKGWTPVGTVTGRNSIECERRFFEDWLPRQDVLRIGGADGSSYAGGVLGHATREPVAAGLTSRGGALGWLGGVKQADA